MKIKGYVVVLVLSFFCSTAVVEYSADKQEIFRTPYIFAVSTQARALLLAAGSEAKASGWLYAFNPLMSASKFFTFKFSEDFLAK